MKCFYHHEHDAIALCKSCHRAICPACAADVPPGIACRNSCEADVAALNLIIERNKSAYQKAGTAYRRNATATFIIGLVFLSIGGIPLLTHGDSGSPFMIVLGLVFFLWAYFSYKSGRQIESSEAR